MPRNRQKGTRRVDDKEIVRLERTLKKLCRKKETDIGDYFPLTNGGIHVRHGLISDTHLGNVHNNLDFLHTIYDIFQKEGVDLVFHCGDMVDGEKVYRGQEYELYVHGARKQVDNVIENYPERDGIKTMFITGNHDLSYQKQAGIDIGDLIASGRDDMQYLGPEEMTLIIGKPKKRAKIMLMHPGKGTAYAVSYHPQKIAESFSGGNKPNALYIGHYHKAEYLPCQRNIEIVQAGCLENQTPYMARNFIPAHQGGWICDMYIDSDFSIRKFKTEFFSHYGKKRVIEL